MKYGMILAALFAVMLGGCASMQYAGTASYSVAPVFAQDGSIHCCKVDVFNGKEIAALNVHIVWSPTAGYTVDLNEQGVAAFKGQEIAAGAVATGAQAATVAAEVAGAALAAPAMAGLAGAALTSGGVGAAAVGAAAGYGVTKAVKP